jgi:hypothetical protein
MAHSCKFDDPAKLYLAPAAANDRAAKRVNELGGFGLKLNVGCCEMFYLFGER